MQVKDNLVEPIAVGFSLPRNIRPCILSRNDNRPNALAIIPTNATLHGKAMVDFMKRIQQTGRENGTKEKKGR
jgi:hypothetical protein